MSEIIRCGQLQYGVAYRVLCNADHCYIDDGDYIRVLSSGEVVNLGNGRTYNLYEFSGRYDMRFEKAPSEFTIKN